MSYLEELLPEFRKGAKIRRSGLPKPKNGKGYVYYKDGKIYNEFDREIEPDLGLWLSKDDWELYQEPIDWDYIIENKCLCWFYDCASDFYKLGFLSETYIDGGDTQRFIDTEDNEWLNCCPVRRDEVTFYEDRKDE